MLNLSIATKKRKDSLKKGAKTAVLRANVKKRALLQLILLYLASKVNKPRRRTVKTSYVSIFLHFCAVNIFFFLAKIQT